MKEGEWESRRRGREGGREVGRPKRTKVTSSLFHVSSSLSFNLLHYVSPPFSSQALGHYDWLLAPPTVNRSENLACFYTFLLPNKTEHM